MSPSRKRLYKARTHPFKRSSERNDSRKRHQRSQSDVPQTPHSQEVRLKRKSRDSRGRSNSVVSHKRRPLRELSPSERNVRTPTPELGEQHISPWTTTEMEEDAQSTAQSEQASFTESEESATYFKSPFPTQPSQILLPSPTTTPSVFISYDENPIGAQLGRELSVGASDTPDFFKDLDPEPLSTESRRNSASTGAAASLTEDEDLPYPISNSWRTSDMYASTNSRSSMMQSTVRSIQPSEEFPSATSVRSSASSETFSTRCHEDRKSTGSNWTIHGPMSASTRPTSTNPRTPSPFGISTKPTPLFGPRTPGVSKDKRPVSTFGNPLSPYLENGSALRPVSASDAYSGKVSNFGSSDELLADLTSPTVSGRPRNSAVNKAYQTTSSPDMNQHEIRSVSGMSCATDDEREPAPLCVPKKVARPRVRQSWTDPLPSSSTQPEPIQRLPTIPSTPHSIPSSDFSSRDTINGSLVTLPTMQIDGSTSPSTRTKDRGEESSAIAAARAEIPPLRNPWQSMDSTSFFNMMMGRDAGDGGKSVSGSRPTTKASRSSSAATVVYAAKGLPAWARSFYSNGDTSVIGSSSRPSTRSKPSQSSLRHSETNSNRSRKPSDGSRKRSHPYNSRTASSSGRPTNTAPTDSPASSQFSIASIQRPRNRPRSTIYSENWTPSPNLPPEATEDEEEEDSDYDDSDDDDDESDFDNYSAGIESHVPSTAQSNTTGPASRQGPTSRHQQHQPQLRNISDIPTVEDDSPYNTQRRWTSSLFWNRGGSHSQRPLRYFGPSDPESNETPRLHRDQSSAYYASSTKSFRYLRPSSWVCGDNNNSDNPNRPAADRQMWLFCLGFILPFAWMLAAFLPVPEKRRHGGVDAAAYSRHEEKQREKTGSHRGNQQQQREKRGGRQSRRGTHVEAEDGSGGVVDVEAQMEAAQVGVLMERERVRAVWWRQLNRRMSVVGVAIIVVVAVIVAVTLTVA